MTRTIDKSSTRSLFYAAAVANLIRIIQNLRFQSLRGSNFQPRVLQFKSKRFQVKDDISFGRVPNVANPKLDEKDCSCLDT